MNNKNSTPFPPSPAGDPPPPLPTPITAATSDHFLSHPVTSSKLRLMISYGGHILPRPHDKSLAYIGGTTRLLLLDRPNHAVSLLSRISRSLPLNSHRFTLKYLLPNDDLDSLVSLSSDEDLHNFLDEYDRLLLPGHSSSSPRIRLFLFFDCPATATSLSPLFNRLDGEDWFLNALNSADHVLTLPQSISDSAANAHDLFFCKADVGHLALAPIKVRIKDLDIDRAAADQRTSDQGHWTGVGRPPLHSPQERVHAVHHKVALTDSKVPSPYSVTSDIVASSSSLSRPACGGQPMNPTPMTDLPELSPFRSELAHIVPPSLIDHQYQVLPQQTRPKPQQQQNVNTSANYMPQGAVAGAGQVVVQTYYPMYVVPARANITAAQVRPDLTAPTLVQLPSGQYLPHQQRNLPGIHLSRSTAVPSAAYSFDHQDSLFDQSNYYGQLPAQPR